MEGERLARLGMFVFYSSHRSTQAKM